MKSIKNLISLGYLLMALLVIGIMYIWYKEWCDLEKLEVQNRHIDTFRQESHEIFVFLIELSLSGETVLEWEDADLEHYHYQRMAIDSMLCRFKTIYPNVHLSDKAKTPVSYLPTSPTISNPASVLLYQD